MNPERWKQIKSIFNQALEVEGEKRPEFLDRVCRDDPFLRTEVESLIASHQNAGDFIEKPVYEAAPELLEEPSPESWVGRRLGPYAILKQLGQGGMGVVYLAEDTRLRRLVSMKALAPEFTRQEQHRERLRREARAAAALSHPGVATVYSLEEFEGTLFIVGEYVRGESLKSELENAPLPDTVFLETALQIAQALAAAHEQGIVHRDLKPENVMRTPEGCIKILDFGLARIQAEGGGTAAPGDRLTRSGVFLGTPAYASPEQLRALEVDARTDIFSLGIILFELASGVHPFGGRSSISTVARILGSDPPSLSPPALEKIIRRCLSKDPQTRYSNGRALVKDLEKLRAETASGRSPVDRPSTSDTIDRAQARALWWWQFHQLTVAICYYLLLFPLWRAREWSPSLGSLVFFGSLVAVGISANLRFHLAFSSRVYPTQINIQRRRSGPWIRAGDLGFFVLLVTGSLAIQAIHAFWAALLLGAGVASLVAFVTIEPAAARAAFGED